MEVRMECTSKANLLMDVYGIRLTKIINQTIIAFANGKVNISFKQHSTSFVCTILLIC